MQMITSPRPTIYWNSIGASTALQGCSWWKQSFPIAPLPLCSQTAREGMWDAFQDAHPPLSSPSLALCVHWLLSSSQMAVIIQTWDLASRLLRNTLDGWRGSSPRGGSFICSAKTFSLLSIQPLRED